MPVGNVPTPGQAPAWAAGTYKSTSIRVTSTNDAGEPTFIERDGYPAIRIHCLVTGSDDGPPFTVRRGEIPLLVMAYGGNPTQLPDVNNPLAYLAALPRLAHGKTVNVVVNERGWVSYIEGMDVPVGEYRLEFVRISSREKGGGPTIMAGKFGPFMWVEQRVVGDRYGGKTYYDGAIVRDSVGVPLTIENGVVVYEKQEGDRYLEPALAALVRLYTPLNGVSLYSGDYRSIPEFLAALEVMALKQHNVIVAPRQYNKDKTRIVTSLTAPVSEVVATGAASPSAPPPAPEPAAPPAPVAEPPPAEPEPVGAITLIYLWAAIEKGVQAGDETVKVFDKTGNLINSETFRQWSKTVGLKAKAEAATGQTFATVAGMTAAFGQMTDVQVVALLRSLGFEKEAGEAETMLAEKADDMPF